MQKNRMEAFSDGVIAIIITIMVLEIKVPHETTINALLAIAPVFLSYLLRFYGLSQALCDSRLIKGCPVMMN